METAQGSTEGKGEKSGAIKDGVVDMSADAVPREASALPQAAAPRFTVEESKDVEGSATPKNDEVRISQDDTMQ